MDTIKVFTAFSGYDSQCLAMDRLKRDYPDFDYELVGWSEIDKYAIQAHDALFPQWADRNYGDISKIDWSQVPDFDLFTYSFPCQDISNAGLQRGFEDGSETRSSLLWECLKAIVEKRPKYLLLENVKALVSKKFLPMFNKWIKSLEDYGYYNNWSVLNTKDFGVPQNRERVFLMSIRRDLLDPNPVYNFPKPFPLEIRLKDVLEEKVDEKYYLSDKIVEGFNAHKQRMKERGNGFGWKPTDGGGLREPSSLRQAIETMTTLSKSHSTHIRMRCLSQESNVSIILLRMVEVEQDIHSIILSESIIPMEQSNKWTCILGTPQ